MTRKEAAEMISDDISLHHDYLSGVYRKALRMAIDALEKLPDKHGRLVDVDALCEDLLERWSVAEKRKEELIKAVMADVVTPIIACQPTIVEAEGDE